MDLLTDLRQNKSIKSSTIDSLIRYGFDSNETLITLDLDSDLPQMTDISRHQKSVLKQVLSEWKSELSQKISELNDNNNNNRIGDEEEVNCNESQLRVEDLLEIEFSCDDMNAFDLQMKNKERGVVEEEEEVAADNGKGSKRTCVSKNARISANNSNTNNRNEGKNNRKNKPKKCKSIFEPTVRQYIIRHGNNLFECEFENCGKRTNRLSHIKEHIRRHLDIKEFCCDTCGQSFVSKTNLKQHIFRVHKTSIETNLINNSNINTTNTALSLVKTEISLPKIEISLPKTGIALPKTEISLPKPEISFIKSKTNV